MEGTKHYPDITICPFPAYNRTALMSHGYPNSFDYARGVNDSKHFIGWRGHHDVDIEEINTASSTFKSVDDCPFAKTYFDLGEEGTKGVSLSFSLTQSIHPSGTCCKANIPEESRTEVLSGILIVTTNLQLMESYKVFVSGQESATYFQKNKFNINGAYLEARNGTGYSLYRLKVMEEISLESDPNFGCTNYPSPGDYAKVTELF